MSRGGRRRKGKRSRRATGAIERRIRQADQDGAEDTDRPERPSKRRGAGRAQARDDSVLEQMIPRRTGLQTLPPDGIVLEELIGALQSEYGVPTTPQEYRLIIKTPAPEEPTDPSIEARPAPQAAASEEGDDVEETEPGTGVEGASRSSRRRRRGRRRTGGSAGITGVLEAEQVAAEPPTKE